MKKLLAACLLAALPCGRAAALADDDLVGEMVSTDTVSGEESAADDEAQASIQESDEDLAGFVQDYVGKDIQLKGAFFVEDKATGSVLKLRLESVPKKSVPGPENSRIVEAAFRNAAGRKYSVLFYIQNAGFGGIDIFRIELKKAGKLFKK